MAKPTADPVVPQHAPDGPLAIASLVCGILSLTGPGLLLGIPAIVLGIMSLRHKEAGRGYSITGIVTGAVSTVISLLFILFLIWLIIMGANASAPGGGGMQPQQPYGSSRI